MTISVNRNLGLPSTPQGVPDQLFGEFNRIYNALKMLAGYIEQVSASGGGGSGTGTTIQQFLNQQGLEETVETYFAVQGNQGNAGPAGATGPAGIGLIGPEGEQGESGQVIPGGVGPQGIQGIQGIAGIQGTQGNDGDQGDDGRPIPGDRGIQGPQGVQGNTGDTGPFIIGPEGEQGNDGQAIPGGLGPQGSIGPQGIQGPAGDFIVGQEGDVGQDGQTIQGPPGTQGNIGPVGPAGMTTILFGDDGEDGRSIPGNNGNDGIQGLVGPVGPPGMTTIYAADDGEDGRPVPGNQGVQGPTGLAGAGTWNYVYNTLTSDTTPADGFIKFDSLTVPTRMNFGGADANAVDNYKPTQSTLANRDTPIKGYLFIVGATTRSVVFAVTGCTTGTGSIGSRFTGYVVFDNLSGGFASGEALVVWLMLRGDDGKTIRGNDGDDGNDGYPIPGNIGPQGTQGLVGPQGPIGYGLSGEDGLDGFTVPGNVGASGTNGVNGVRWLVSSGSPNGVVPANLNDLYLQTPSGEVWQCAGGTIWVDLGFSLIGAAGMTTILSGEDGADGYPIPGTPGAAGSNGSPGAQGIPGIAIPNYNDNDEQPLNFIPDSRDFSIHDIWKSYTPVLTSAVGSFGGTTCTGKFKKIGTTVHVIVNLTVNSNGTASGQGRCTLPLAVKGFLSGCGYDTGNNDFYMAGLNGASGFLFLRYDNTFTPNLNNWTFSFTYETN